MEFAAEHFGKREAPNGKACILQKLVMDKSHEPAARVASPDGQRFLALQELTEFESDQWRMELERQDCVPHTMYCQAKRFFFEWIGVAKHYSYVPDR